MKDRLLFLFCEWLLEVIRLVTYALVITFAIHWLWCKDFKAAFELFIGFVEKGT